MRLGHCQRQSHEHKLHNVDYYMHTLCALRYNVFIICKFARTVADVHPFLMQRRPCDAAPLSNNIKY